MDSTENQPFWHGMVAGGSSAVISRFVTYPPDTVKSRLQVQGGGSVQYKGTADAFIKIAKAEGIPGFYRGFAALVITVVPANMCYFSGYEFGKRITPRTWGVASDLMTATIAQTIAGVVFCPIDIVKQRVQTANVMHIGASATTLARITPVQAAKEVWTHQGMRGFYRGFWAMNALWMPWNLIYLTLYEGSKRKIYRHQLRTHNNNNTKIQQNSNTTGIESDAHAVTIIEGQPISQVLPPWAFPLCSSTSASIAALVTHPIDVVKTRLQVLSVAEHGQTKRTAFNVAADLWATEGARGFIRGIGARVVTLSMGSSTSWFVYEMVKRKLASSSQNV